MIPRPPSCISTSRTQSPKWVNVLLISSTESPVTHTAEVAVNKASKKEMGVRSDTGSRSKIAPTRISNK